MTDMRQLGSFLLIVALTAAGLVLILQTDLTRIGLGDSTNPPPAAPVGELGVADPGAPLPRAEHRAAAATRDRETGPEVALASLPAKPAVDPKPQPIERIVPATTPPAAVEEQRAVEPGSDLGKRVLDLIRSLETLDPATSKDEGLVRDYRRARRLLQRRELVLEEREHERRVQAAVAAGDWHGAAQLSEAFAERLAKLRASELFDTAFLDPIIARADNDVRATTAKRDRESALRLWDDLAPHDNPWHLRSAIMARLSDDDLPSAARQFLQVKEAVARVAIESWERRAEELVRTPLRSGNVAAAYRGLLELQRQGAIRAFLLTLHQHFPRWPAQASGAPAAPALLPLAWVAVVPGDYWIGTPEAEAQRQEDEFPPRQVTVGEPFLIAATEVSQRAFRAVVPGKSWSRYTGGELPAHSVTLDEAIEFCRRLDEIHPGLSFALPTEAQWEIAARGAVTRRDDLLPIATDDPTLALRVRRGGGNPIRVMRAFAHFALNASGGPQPVGAKRPNPLGMFDVAGNVAEWCDGTGLETPGETPRPATRGGAANDPYSACRAGARRSVVANTRSPWIGFRVICKRR